MKCAIMMAACALAAPAAMAEFDIFNASFELPAQAPNSFTTGGATGWSVYAGGGSWGTFYPTVAVWGFEATHGNQVLYTNGPIVQQTLADVLIEGMTYTLEIDVANRPTFGNLDYTIELVAGTTVIASDYGSLAPPVGGWLTSTLTYTVMPGDPLIGEAITIRLGGPSQCDFDNVRLNGVPTPGALALAGVAGLLTGRRRR